MSVGIESISITPEIQLPEFSPPWPEELRSLIEECHTGLYKIIISKMVERNKYDQVAILSTMENINPHGKPSALPEEICECIMLVAQYDYERFDTYYKYKAEIISGGKGKARRAVSKHFELTSDGEVSRTVNVMNEGEILEQQSNYIGELHSQIIGMAEVTQGMVKPLLSEFKELVKVVSDSQRRLADIEAKRMEHEMQMQIYNDEKEQKRIESERAHERWLAFKNTLDQSGVIPMAMAQLAAFVKRKAAEHAGDQPSPEERMEAMSGALGSPDENIHKNPGKKKSGKKSKSKKKKQNLSENKVDDIVAERAAAYEDNPVLGSAAALKMSFDSYNQWEKIEETLTIEQFEVFKAAIEGNTEKEVKENIRKLAHLPDLKNLVELSNFMDENQAFFVDQLMQLSLQVD